MQIKKSLFKAFVAGVTGLLTQYGIAAETPSGAQILYPAGSQQSFEGPEAYFTGEVRVDMLFPGNDSAHYSGAYVTFQPGARTAWHLHPAGQHMIVTNGTALTGTREGKVIEFKKGETAWCPSNIDHWHGATPDAPMTHLVITGDRNGENVIWKEKVTDEQYFGGHQPRKLPSANVDALTDKQQSIIPIAAFTANGDLKSLRVAIERGLNGGLSINEIKEIQVHLYAYVGFPRALNGLATLMKVVDDRKAKEISDPVGETATPLPAKKSSLELGQEIQTELVGKPVSEPLFDFAPSINTFLQSHLFGDLFGRGILDYQGREIATLSALASIEGVEPQFKAHVGIASNVGLTGEQLKALAAILKKRVNQQAGTRAESALRK